MLNEDQLNELKLVRRALNDIHKVLDTKLYKKNVAAKVSYSEINPSTLVTDNLKYIVEKLNKLTN
tara:strand:+ start:310 stop:504 length:195 start_codon:yes stop_codon:yes gene_type:complete